MTRKRSAHLDTRAMMDGRAGRVEDTLSIFGPRRVGLSLYELMREVTVSIRLTFSSLTFARVNQLFSHEDFVKTLCYKDRVSCMSLGCNVQPPYGAFTPVDEDHITKTLKAHGDAEHVKGTSTERRIAGRVGHSGTVLLGQEQVFKPA